jgi:hypothetical protein
VKLGVAQPKRAVLSLSVAIMLGGVLGVASGCTYEKRTVRGGLLAGLPGAIGGETVVLNTGKTMDPTIAPLGGIRQVDDRGNVTLLARSAKHVMAHIYTTLANGERDLFIQQVLSERTRLEFEDRGLDPGLAFDELKKRERDLLKFFNTLPFAEHTPGVHLEGLGPNVFRMRSPGGRNSGLRYQFMDLIIERGEWRLRWFG